MNVNDLSEATPYTRSVKDGIDPPNVVMFLNARQYGLKPRFINHKRKFAEFRAVSSQFDKTHCELPPSARSTFLMTFSHDCTKVASTHGDHNIYISDIKTGRNLQKLEGHPRTPWCIAFHPSSSDMLASGCLAGEVRIWDLHGGSEKWKVHHSQVIASLAFHPLNQLLVIATGSCLYFWDWSQPKPEAYCSTNSELERVRFVKFDQYGRRLITGISNVSASTSNSNARRSLRAFNPHPLRRADYDERLSRLNASVNRERVRSPEPPSADAQESLDVSESDVSDTEITESIHFSIHSAVIDDDVESDNYSETDQDAEAAPVAENNSESEVANDFFTSGEFWDAFIRLRTLCTELERRLIRHVNPSDDDLEPRAGPSVSNRESNIATSSSNSVALGTDDLDQEFPNLYASIINMLVRIRLALRFSTISLTAVRDRIDQVRRRIREIISRLRYWTRRRNIGRVRQDIFEEMTAQLTEQMENLIQTDARLANSVSFSQQRSSQSVEQPTTSQETSNSNSGQHSAYPFGRIEVDIISSESSDEDDMLHNPDEYENISTERIIESLMADIAGAGSTDSRILLPSFAATSIDLNDSLTQNHRIQCWDFSHNFLPPIYNANANIVVPKCMIHNDASVDISQDGEKLVALIPPDEKSEVCFRVGVFSLKSGNLGKMHIIWGHISNAISVSFSPLAEYIVVGSSYTRPLHSYAAFPVIAHIVKINQKNDSFEPVYIRSLRQLYSSERFQHVSLNCVRWLPESGRGMAYATNRGHLCICKTRSGEIPEEDNNNPPTEVIRLYIAQENL